MNIKKIIILLLAFTSLMLSGCTSHMYQEKRFEQSKPAESMSISFIKNPNIQGKLSTVGPVGMGNFKNAKELANRDISILLQNTEIGIKTKLPTLLEQNGMKVFENQSDAEGNLRIFPENYVVECGNGGSICNASVYFRVSFYSKTDKKETWRAGFKVGVPFGQEQTVEGLTPFFEDITSRLRAFKIGAFK